MARICLRAKNYILGSLEELRKLKTSLIFIYEIYNHKDNIKNYILGLIFSKTKATDEKKLTKYMRTQAFKIKLMIDDLNNTRTQKRMLPFPALNVLLSNIEKTACTLSSSDIDELINPHYIDI